MRKLINVLKSDISSGRKRDSDCCPIALALKRQVPELKISVGHRFYTNKGAFDAPRSAVRFIKRFDKGQPVKPFNFYLEIPHGVEVEEDN